ncbi:MAG: DUF998 domain-containing protein [Gemmatimonadales bacterium]
MRKWLLAAGYLPLPLFLGSVFVAGFFVPGYSHLRQHASELGRPSSPVYPYYNWFATALGLAIVAFAVGMVLELANRRRPILGTAATMLLTGAAFASNGVFPMGSPLHGLYGLAIFSVIAKLVVVVEAGEVATTPRFRDLTVVVTVATMYYLWSMMTGHDPASARGLTQRVFGSAEYAWYALAAWEFQRPRLAAASPRDPAG